MDAHDDRDERRDLDESPENFRGLEIEKTERQEEWENPRRILENHVSESHGIVGADAVPESLGYAVKNLEIIPARESAEHEDRPQKGDDRSENSERDAGRMFFQVHSP